VSSQASTPLRPAFQILLGLATGVALGALFAAIGLLRIPIPLAGWIAIYAAIWVAIFLALRKHLAVFIVFAFLTTGLISLVTNHLLATP
jgi:hypothetical protein